MCYCIRVQSSKAHSEVGVESFNFVKEPEGLNAHAQFTLL